MADPDPATTAADVSPELLAAVRKVVKDAGVDATTLTVLRAARPLVAAEARAAECQRITAWLRDRAMWQAQTAARALTEAADLLDGDTP